MIEIYGNKKTVINLINVMHTDESENMGVFVLHEDEIFRKTRGKKKLTLTISTKYMPSSFKGESKKNE